MNWTAHNPGDPCPCEPTQRVQVRLRTSDSDMQGREAMYYDWTASQIYPDSDIVAWRPMPTTPAANQE